MRKKLYNIVSLFVLFGVIFCSMPLYANEIEMDTKTEVGSITIALEDTQNQLPKEDVEFVCVKVADVKDGTYEFSNVFEEQKMDLNNMQSSEELLDIAWQLKKNLHDIKGTSLKTNKDGVLKFENLSVGVYLVFATDINNYELIYPTLVSIPTFNEVSGQMDYDVTMIPKHTRLPVIQVNKVDSVTNKNILEKAFAFTLYSDRECKQELQTQQGNKTTGIASFVLPYGIYYMKETIAPKGYIQSEEVMKIEIREEGIKINGSNLCENQDGVYDVYFKNVKKISVPQTSDETSLLTQMGTLFGASMVVLVLFYRRKRYNL